MNNSHNLKRTAAGFVNDKVGAHRPEAYGPTRYVFTRMPYTGLLGNSLKAS